MKTIDELGISPTPWTINEDGDVLCKYISNAIQPNEIRARVVARPNFYFDESKSDAHLIAAAPDLYEALQSLVEYIDRECIPCGETACELMYYAHNVLAKASGESEAADER